MLPLNNPVVTLQLYTCTNFDNESICPNYTLTWWWNCMPKLSIYLDGEFVYPNWILIRTVKLHTQIHVKWFIEVSRFTTLHMCRTVMKLYAQITILQFLFQQMRTIFSTNHPPYYTTSSTKYVRRLTRAGRIGILQIPHTCTKQQCGSAKGSVSCLLKHALCTFHGGKNLK